MEINLPPSFSRLHRILVETSTLRCKFIAELLINFHSSRRSFPLTDFRQVLGSIFLTNSYSGNINWKASSSFPTQSFRNREDNIPLSKKKPSTSFKGKVFLSLGRRLLMESFLGNTPQHHRNTRKKQRNKQIRCVSVFDLRF